MGMKDLVEDLKVRRERALAMGGTEAIAKQHAEGKLTVRHPGGEAELDPGDLVCFPAGPDGAHKLTNRTEAPVKMLIVSTRRMPAVAVYPDSDKIGVFTEKRRDDLMVRRSSDVDYWDGER